MAIITIILINKIIYIFVSSADSMVCFKFSLQKTKISLFSSRPDRNYDLVSGDGTSHGS